MSGGSYDYIYSKLEAECSGRMYDYEMNDLIEDLIPLLKELEWWQSCDTSEEDYKKEVKKFKDKWFKQDRKERLKNYIDESVNKLRKQLYELLEEN